MNKDLPIIIKKVFTNPDQTKLAEKTNGKNV